MDKLVVRKRNSEWCVHKLVFRLFRIRLYREMHKPFGSWREAYDWAYLHQVVTKRVEESLKSYKVLASNGNKGYRWLDQ